jgi:single-stranded-DNA-specific exonuclease
MGDARDAFELFTTADEARAEELSRKLEKLNRERKAQAGAITRTVRERLSEREHIRSVIALGDPAWRPALLGLVANGIAEEYNRPVFLWGREANQTVKGSCRAGGEGAHVVHIMNAAIDTFAQFGGHAMSGGFTVKDDAIFTLEDRLVEAYDRVRSEHVSTEPLTDELADAELPLTGATMSFLTKLEALAPFGVQNTKPLFLFRNVSAQEISRFGKSGEHLKLKLFSSETGRSLEAVSFFVKGRLAERVKQVVPGSVVSVTAHIERDAFSRVRPVRLRLRTLSLV